MSPGDFICSPGFSTRGKVLKKIRSCHCNLGRRHQISSARDRIFPIPTYAIGGLLVRLGSRVVGNDELARPGRCANDLSNDKLNKGTKSGEDSSFTQSHSIGTRNPTHVFVSFQNVRCADTIELLLIERESYQCHRIGKQSPSKMIRMALQYANNALELSHWRTRSDSFHRRRIIIL
jgi:hypothetical protein